jgi:hypothetical protein
MRLNPIMLRITGSDGYLGEWREHPVSQAEVVCENKLNYPYHGILETDRVSDAKYDTFDSMQLSGVDGSERAVEVSEDFDFESVERVRQCKQTWLFSSLSFHVDTHTRNTRVYVYMYVCTYIQIHISTYLWMELFISLSLYINTCKRIHWHIPISMYMVVRVTGCIHERQPIST